MRSLQIKQHETKHTTSLYDSADNMVEINNKLTWISTTRYMVTLPGGPGGPGGPSMIPVGK